MAALVARSPWDGVRGGSTATRVDDRGRPARRRQLELLHRSQDMSVEPSKESMTSSRRNVCGATNSIPEWRQTGDGARQARSGRSCRRRNRRPHGRRGISPGRGRSPPCRRQAMRLGRDRAANRSPTTRSARAMMRSTRCVAVHALVQEGLQGVGHRRPSPPRTRRRDRRARATSSALCGSAAAEPRGASRSRRRRSAP